MGFDLFSKSEHMPGARGDFLKPGANEDRRPEFGVRGFAREIFAIA